VEVGADRDRLIPGVGEQGLEGQDEGGRPGDEGGGDDRVPYAPLRQRDQDRDRPHEHPERPEVDDLEADVGGMVDKGVGRHAERVENGPVQPLEGPDPVGADEDDGEAGHADEEARHRMSLCLLDHLHRTLRSAR
jgi:hypothetical protein